MKSKIIAQIAITSLIAVFAIAGIIYAATTIGTNINTGGTLTVSGTTSLNGVTYTWPSADGSSGQFLTTNGSGTMSWSTASPSSGGGWTDGGGTVYPTAMADQFLIGTTTAAVLSQLTVEATSTAAIPLTLRGYNGQTANLLQIHDVGGSELFAIDASGYASSTLLSVSSTLYTGGNNGLVLADGSITDNSGSISFGNETLTTTGTVNFNTASSTGLASLQSLKISSTGDTIANIQFGTCSVDPQSITASSSALVSTSCTATGVQSGDQVFVTPPTAMENSLILVGASASTTAAGYIEIKLHNTGNTGAVNGASRTWSWMAIR